jgi:hypothetical protein
VISGLHGDEKLPPEFVRWLIERVKNGEGPLAALGKDVAFDFIPAVNPDGLAAGTRYNARGVNLNRNFGALWGVSREPMGEKAFSEPETRAVRDVMLATTYTAAVDVHGYINWVVGPTPPSQASRLGETVAWGSDQRYASWVSTLRGAIEASFDGYLFKTAGGLGDGGAFEDWAFWRGKTLSACIEIRSEQESFARYETFVAKMFKGAIDLKSREDAVAVARR